MMLEEIQIEGFRSLKSVTWNPARLNVLIGPNGGDKSNLLRALDLLRIVAAGDPRDAILRMGGMVPLLWDGEARQIDVRFRIRVNAHALKYWLQFGRVGTTGDVRVDLKESPNVVELQQSAGPTSIADFMRNLSAQAALHPEIKTWSIHGDMRVDQDAELRRAAVSRSEKRVDPDGQNLIAVLHTLYTTDREFEEFIDSSMATAFPDDYEKLSFPPAEDGRVQLRLKRKHRKRADSASDLSDGTLRFLLLLTILGSPDAGSLIAIDEPETGLHPRMMSIIAAAAANAALKSQIIFTTHSPSFLDAFPADDPPQTTVVTSNGSETQLKTISGDELKKWIEEYSLGKFAFSGEAEAVL
jgi:predicted ATPase